jgi:hypothetical protein
MNRILWHLALSATALTLFPTGSGAQTPATKQPAVTFDELRGVLRSGDHVFVTDSNGRRTEGKVVAVTSSSLDLTVKQRRFLFLEQDVDRVLVDTAVTTVQRIDSRLEGAYVGFAAVFFPLMVAGCDADEPPFGCEGAVIGAAAFGVLGSVIGAAIDGVINTTVYRAGPAQSGGATVTLSPLLSGGTKGARFGVRF